MEKIQDRFLRYVAVDTQSNEESETQPSEFKELDLLIILMTPQTQTLSYLSFTYSQEGLNQMADAISVVVLAFILVCYIIAHAFGADIGKGW